MAGWHHWLDGRESEWTPGVGDGQGGLACCDSLGRKESDRTERLNWTEGISEVHAKFLQSCPTLCNGSPSGSSVHGILQARLLECVAIPFSKGISVLPLFYKEGNKPRFAHRDTDVLISKFLQLSYMFPMTTESTDYSSHKFWLFSQGTERLDGFFQGHSIMTVNPGLLGLTLSMKLRELSGRLNFPESPLFFSFLVCKPEVTMPTWQNHFEDWVALSLLSWLHIY